MGACTNLISSCRS